MGIGVEHRGRFSRKDDEVKRKLFRKMMGWEPHYQRVERHVDIPEGTEVTLLSEVDEPWQHRPGEGHTYWCFGWTDTEGKYHATWTRTYSHIEITPLFQPEEPTELPSVGGSK